MKCNFSLFCDFDRLDVGGFNMVATTALYPLNLLGEVVGLGGTLLL